MAKKRFRIKDAQGNVVPYDVAAEDVTLSDGRSVEAGKASVLNNAGFLDPAHFPKLMLYNVTPFTSEPDYSAIPVGSIYLDEREDAPYKRLFYKKNIDGNTQTIDLGAPQDGVVYCHQSTGILYRWVPTSYGRDGSFQQVGGDADLRDDSNHVKQSLATPVVLRNVSAATLDDLAVGDVYFDEGHLFCHVSSSNDADLGAPSKKLIYFCLADSKCYRWTGSSFTAITVAPHIDPTTGNWFIGSTNTGVSAQGPRGNTVVLDPNEVESFDIINNLTDGGEGDALSAEMGKWLYTNLYMIFSQLGTYAFPNGKPQIDWGGGNPPVIPPCTVSKTIGTGLSSTGGDSDVAFGDPLEVSIAITDNLYIVDDDSVEVTMGGSPVQGAWNASTMKVTIAAVTGNVVINVPSMTYVGYGESNSHLVAMFDGMNRGSVTDEWSDVMDRTRKVGLNQCTEQTDHVEFDGQNSTAFAASTDIGVNTESANATIEVVLTGMTCNGTSGSTFVVPFANHRYAPNGTFKRLIGCNIGYSAYYPNGGGVGASFYQLDSENNESSTNLPKSWLLNKSSISPADVLHLSLSGLRAKLNGVTLSNSNYQDYTGVKNIAKMGIMSRINNSGVEQKFAGKIYCIRIYDTQLSADDIAKNYAIDRKRFKLL